MYVIYIYSAIYTYIIYMDAQVSFSFIVRKKKKESDIYCMRNISVIYTDLLLFINR